MYASASAGPGAKDPPRKPSAHVYCLTPIVFYVFCMVARWVVPVVSHIRLLFVVSGLADVFLENWVARHEMYVLMGNLEKIFVLRGIGSREMVSGGSLVWKEGEGDDGGEE